MKQALKGIRVLDLSRVLAGPWASQMLADMGAEVIKIERPGVGDETRHWGPPWLNDDPGAPSAYYLSCNRGKRSVAVDFRYPQGRRIIRQLAQQSDILLENFRPGKLRAHGLDYQTLSESHPGLIYCSITGFGQDGPYRDRPGYDLLIQAMAGLMSVTGQADAQGGEPVKVGVAVSDILTGLHAANACLAALVERGRSGRGQAIDLSLMDVQVAGMANQAMNYRVSGQSPDRMGNAHPNIVPYQAFQAADDYFIVAVGNDAQFARLCAVVGCPHWAKDPAFATNAARVEHRQRLVNALQETFSARPRDQWLADLEQASVPAGPVNDMAAVFADPQIQARGLATEQHHPVWGPLPAIANPLQRDPQWTGPPPMLGEQTDAVLGEWLGLDSRELDELATAGVIGRAGGEAK